MTLTAFVTITVTVMQAVATISDSIQHTLPVPFLRLYGLEGPAVSLALFKVRMYFLPKHTIVTYSVIAL
jgi:hypothetical protein